VTPHLPPFSLRFLSLFLSHHPPTALYMARLLLFLLGDLGYASFRSFTWRPRLSFLFRDVPITLFVPPFTASRLSPFDQGCPSRLKILGCVEAGILRSSSFASGQLVRLFSASALPCSLFISFPSLRSHFLHRHSRLIATPSFPICYDVSE